MGEAIWRLTDVTVRGADRPRLTGVTLDILPGATAVLGPSGAGKTTLLNLLVGFERPDEGQVDFKSAISNQPPVFWCPPDHGLWPHLTVRQHLQSAASAAFRDRIDAMLHDFDLHNHAGVRPDHLSQGQRSRLSVARSLVTGAAVHVMDEPLVHVDEERSPRYWALIRSVLAETGASLVFSTHDSAVAREHADRSIRLDEGRVVENVPGPARTSARLVGMVLILCLALSGCDASTDASLPIEKVVQHMLPNDGPKVPQPRDLALGEGEELLVIDNAGRVIVLDRSGHALRQWRTPSNVNGNPEGVCRLRDGRIAVADTHYFQVLFFDREGKLLSILGGEGDGPGKFRYPVKVVEDDKGFLYIAEYGGNDRVQKFAPDGTHILNIGSFGTGEGQFQRPSGMVWHEGKLYIADAINNRVLIYSDSGQYLGLLGADVPLKLPYDLCQGPDGRFYIVEYGAGRLTVLDKDGTLVGRFSGGDAGRIANPWGLVVDTLGTVWIADTENRRILEVRR